MNLSEIRKYGNIEFLAKKAVEGFITGLHKSPYNGFSVEFAEHKQYNTGDSTKNIDWKVFARTDKLYLKNYEEETNLRCQLIIDTSSSMFYPAENYGKLTFSIYAAAALSIMLQKQRDAVGFTTFSDEIELNTPIKSNAAHLHKLFIQMQHVLDDAKPSGKQTSIAKTIHHIATKLHKRSLVIIFSDMFENIEQADELFHALQHLRHKKNEVLLFHTVDKKTERDFEFEERPHEFIDLESGSKIKLSPSQVKESYAESMTAYMNDLALKCAQYRIEFIEADINKSLDQILLPYLVKRSKMR